jgi:hypothetical protein
MMKTIARLLLLAAICALVFSTTLLAQDASGERYVVILKHHAGPAPDVSKLGGRIEFRQDEEIVVTLPAGAIERLRQEPLVKYVQRVERPGAAPEPYLLGTPEEPNPERSVTTTARMSLRPQPTAGPWDSGSYSYDGAGNITAIGSQSFAYDGAQRLVRAIMNGTDNYSFDGFGNITAKSVGGAAQSMPAVNHLTNQFQTAGYTYDVAGNLQSDGVWNFTYDSLNQPLSKTYGGTNQNQEYYIYTAGDERIGEQENGWWIWSIRDEGGKVLRQYRSSATDPTVPALWLEDFVWRDGLLLGSERVTEMGGRRHFHLDHLGTPRLVTSDTGQLVSQHDYYPFGEELTAIVQEGPGGGGFDREEPMKFTGHERDFAAGEGREDGHYIDYMHARDYDAGPGRFLSPDPVLGDTRPNPGIVTRTRTIVHLLGPTQLVGSRLRQYTSLAPSTMALYMVASVDAPLPVF